MQHIEDFAFDFLNLFLSLGKCLLPPLPLFDLVISPSYTPTFPLSLVPSRPRFLATPFTPFYLQTSIGISNSQNMHSQRAQPIYRLGIRRHSTPSPFLQGGIAKYTRKKLDVELVYSKTDRCRFLPFRFPVKVSLDAVRMLSNRNAVSRRLILT